MSPLRGHLRLAALGLILFAALLFAPRALAGGDPTLSWWTLETAHFRVHYDKKLEPIAERVARLCESIHETLVEPLGHAPRARTEVALSDVTDSANGSATPVPFNAVRLFVTAPSDLSPLHDYDDWYLGLMTHEYAHILHTDNISGVPALLNTIIGKTVAPNQAQPRWFLEGLAVVVESDFTSAGRIRSTLFDAYLRADVLADNVARLDQFSNNAQRWPQGSLWYLYGARFLHFISELYGRDALRAVLADYGSTVIPWGINRAIRRQTGHTYEELYRGFVSELKSSYARQLASVHRRGLREGTRLTARGRLAFYPSFVPQIAGKYVAGGAALIYHRDDFDSRAGLYQLDLDASGTVTNERLVARTVGDAPVAHDPQGNLWFSSTVPFRQIYRRTDLFQLTRGHDAPEGDEPSRRRLSIGMRATAPSISPDGRLVVFTVNHQGTTTLSVAPILETGSRETGSSETGSPETGSPAIGILKTGSPAIGILKTGSLSSAILGDVRPLVRPAHAFDQAYTPRFSPDGRFVAYSAWKQGGFRDVQLVDVSTGRVRELTHDRALDLEPCWSPDGARIYFASDRTGIFNIYELELETGRLAQVTNVRTAAVMPAISPDGRRLVYVGYTSRGYDLFTMPLERDRFLAALPALVDRPRRAAPIPPTAFKKHRYDPLGTLTPRAYTFSSAPGSFGSNAYTFRASGADMAGLHAFAFAIVADPAAPLPQASLDYDYGRLPVDLGVSIANRVVPRTDYRIADQNPEYIEKSFSVRTTAGYRIPSEFASQSLSLSYSASVLDRALPVASVTPDPYAALTLQPLGGFLGTVRLGYSLSRTESGHSAAGSRRGYALSLSVDAADRFTGSSESFYSASYNAVGYLPMPWRGNHVLALRSAGGMSTGSYARRGTFYVGGYDLERNDLLDTLLSGGGGSGGFVLRGYPPSAFKGSTFLLETAEYRLPIATPDRGPSTLPAYLRRIDASLFIDYGGAFDEFDFRAVHAASNGALIDSPALHTGAGAELWFGATLGYVFDFTMRLGYAFGFSSGRVDGGQPYFLAASAF
ncbi:MAG: hypothetical protein EXR75_00030 [Myxococcales bacterium]|nr:hypothetical protein [Myxococcales bacterium]